MAELRKVPGPTSPLAGTSGRIVAVVVAGIILAVIKPWGASPADIPRASASPASTASPTSPASPIADGGFDWSVFEGFEPHPAWEIWPAGREVSFGFAMKVRSDIDAANPVPAASDEASRAPGATALSSPPPPSPSPDQDPPTWSDTITISPASTLNVVAINTPRGHRIPVATLSLLGSDGGRVDVPVVRLHSPWPDHFHVIGIDDGTGVAGLPAWPPGAYVLDLRIDPGGWARSIMIDVRDREAPGRSPAAPASSEPSATTGG